ncbi:MAG: hypothetical protein ACJ763_16845 [Bdellovibrionia bacterium]
MKKYIALLLVLLVVVVGGYVSIRYYSYVFAKKVTGEIIKVERVNQNDMIIAGRGTTPTQMFSFAVAIRDEKGEIHTASSEDRQWAVAQPKQCATAKFFPYPPWDLDKAGTYYGARLERLFDCPKNNEQK